MKTWYRAGGIIALRCKGNFGTLGEECVRAILHYKWLLILALILE